MILVTGAAGFIGFHVSDALLKAGVPVIGIDNLNDYYDVGLKQARLAKLRAYPNFTFHPLNIADHAAVKKLASPDIEYVIHLAAQAGVRYSLINPFAYAESNLTGQLAMLELCRHLPNLKHFVYASSSSVYGANKTLPFSTEQRVDQPISLYAATKKSAELMGYSYHHLYKIPMTGLRFFTVYGAWGRPDMAYFSFTKALFEEKPITVFGEGQRRDFTYIDDIVAGILACMKKPSAQAAVYNLGNDRSEDLMEFIHTLEDATGKKALLHHAPMQPGDVHETHADIIPARRDFNYLPKTTIAQGLPRFVDWYRAHYQAS